MTGALTPIAIAADLGTAIVGREVVCFAQLPSTMDEARRRAADGPSEGLVVLAEEQTAGRGRMGRAWVAPPGSALLLSLLLRPRFLAPQRAFALTMLAAAALCDAVEETAGLQAALKWPNDLLLPDRRPQTADRRPQTADRSSTDRSSTDRRPQTADRSQTANDEEVGGRRSAVGGRRSKCAGILAELQLQSGQIGWAIIGIGVNVQAHPPPAQTSYPATSLAAALGKPVDRLELLRALLRRLDAGYAALRDAGYDALFAAWRARLATIGQDVRIATAAGVVEGVAEDVSMIGALLVRAGDGALHTITTGDVQA